MTPTRRFFLTATAPLDAGAALAAVDAAALLDPAALLLDPAALLAAAGAALLDGADAAPLLLLPQAESRPSAVTAATAVVAVLHLVVNTGNLHVGGLSVWRLGTSRWRTHGVDDCAHGGNRDLVSRFGNDTV